MTRKPHDIVVVSLDPLDEQSAHTLDSESASTRQPTYRQTRARSLTKAVYAPVDSFSALYVRVEKLGRVLRKDNLTSARQ